MVKLVVPFRSQREVRILDDVLELHPTILLILVPGVIEDGGLVPDQSVVADDIPHIRGVVTHIVPVGPDGMCEEIDLGQNDQIILTKNMPVSLTWAAARLAVNLRPNNINGAGGDILVPMAPVLPVAVLVDALGERTVEE